MWNLKKMIQGNSLVVQWLGLCTSTAGDMGVTPGWGTQILDVIQPKKEKQKAPSRLVSPGLWEDCEKRYHGAGKQKPQGS